MTPPIIATRMKTVVQLKASCHVGCYSLVSFFQSQPQTDDQRRVSSATASSARKQVLSRAYSPSNRGSVSPRGGGIPSSPGSGVSSSPPSIQRPLSSAAASASTRSRIKQEQKQQSVVPRRRQTTSSQAAVSPRLPSELPGSPSPIQPPRRSTVGEIAVFRLRESSDSSDAETVSSEDGDFGASSEPPGNADAGLDLADVSDSLEHITQGSSTSGSFSFLTSSVAVEEDELLTAPQRPSAVGRDTADEVAEEPSSAHLHARLQERRSSTIPESPPDTPHMNPASSALPAACVTPPHLTHDSPPVSHCLSDGSTWSGGDALVAAGGDDSVLFGSVVGGAGGMTAEDSVLFGSPVRTLRAGAGSPAVPATASRAEVLGGGTPGYFSVASPMRPPHRTGLPPSGNQTGASKAGYLAEPTAIIYSPER